MGECPILTAIISSISWLSSSSQAANRKNFECFECIRQQKSLPNVVTPKCQSKKSNIWGLLQKDSFFFIVSNIPKSFSIKIPPKQFYFFKCLLQGEHITVNVYPYFILTYCQQKKQNRMLSPPQPFQLSGGERACHQPRAIPSLPTPQPSQAWVFPFSMGQRATITRLLSITSLLAKKGRCYPYP